MIRAHWILCLVLSQAVVCAESPNLMPEESEDGALHKLGTLPVEVPKATDAAPTVTPPEPTIAVQTPSALPRVDVDVPTLSQPPNLAYQIIPNGNNLELVTPYGRRILFGDINLKKARDYRFEIPLSEIRPPEVKPPPPPAPPPGPTVVVAPISRETASEKPPEPPEPKVPPKVVVEYDNTDRLILEANRQYNRGQFYEASLTVEEILLNHPDLARAWVMKGSLMYVQGQKDLAKNAWQKALEIDPKNNEVRSFMGRIK